MINRSNLQPAYVLHSQAFQNTSLLVDLFCLDHGRIRVVARGARRSGSRFRAILQAFQPLLVSFAGRGELKTLHHAESSVAALSLTGMRLFSGLYLNELLTRLLQFNEAHTPLYRAYQQTLIQLHDGGDINRILRMFEIDLLRELGYALNLHVEFGSDDLIDANQSYQFIPELGFQRLLVQSREAQTTRNIFKGSTLVALRNADFSERDTAIAAKRLLRQALRVHLGDKPLTSQQLFQSMSLSADTNTG